MTTQSDTFTITIDWLRAEDACKPEIQRFAEIFPSGVELTSESLQKVEDAGLEIDWLLDRTLGTFTGALRSRRVEAHWTAGKLDREGDQPALIRWHESGEKEREEYWTAGKRDRGDGKPAVTRWHANGEKKIEEYWSAGDRLFFTTFVICPFKFLEE